MQPPHSSDLRPAEQNVARYFVVKAEALKMTPGLFRLGRDFGNGKADRQHFQMDSTRRSYRSAKDSILGTHPERIQLGEDDPARRLQRAALAWMVGTLQREHGVSMDCPPASWAGVRALSLQVQEDFALVHRSEHGKDRLVLLSVCFPSGWRPERLLGASFDSVHLPVPEFEAVARKSAQIVTGIVERGPYVRFVWTVTADPRLDHHPDASPREPWSEDSVGYLRVERQVTVPFPNEQGALFLIRTYLYPFSDLSPAERRTLHQAVSLLPPSVLDYKGLRKGVSFVLRQLV